jgi:hypothetical protein
MSLSMTNWNNFVLKLSNTSSQKKVIDLYEKAQIPIRVRHYLAHWIESNIK